MILLIKQPKQIRRKSEILNIIKFLDQLASFLWDCNETIVVAIQLLRFIRIREKYDYRMEKNYNFLIVLIRNWKQVFRMYFHILEKWQEILWKTENFYIFWDHSQCHNNCFENEHFWQESGMLLCFFENCSFLVVIFFDKYECKQMIDFLWKIFLKTVFCKA